MKIIDFGRLLRFIESHYEQNSILPSRFVSQSSKVVAFYLIAAIA